MPEKRDGLIDAPWSTLYSARSALAASAAAGTHMLSASGAATISTASMNQNPAIFSLDPADYAMSGRLVQIRMVCLLVAPAAHAANTYIYQLRPVTAFSTTNVPTLSASILASSTVTNPGAGAISRLVTAALAMPVAGQFALTLLTTGTGSATGTATIQSSVMLQARVT